jgi:hypothetical protein
VSVIELDISPEFDLIARSLVADKKKRKKNAPKAVDLSTALTSLNIEDTIHGSSTLELGIYDESFNLLDSGFFDADNNGKVDPVDLNYPFNSPQWWRLTQVDYKEDATATLSFMERGAVHMMSHEGPLKVSRGKRTRAQFLKGLTNHVKAGGGIRFVSKDLNVKQTVAKVQEPARRKEDKAKGISLEEGRDLKIGGVHANTEQIRNAETVCDVCEQEQAGEIATLAALVGCIQESKMKNLNYGDRDSLGILQVRVSTSGSARRVRPVARGSEGDPPGLRRCRRRRADLQQAVQLQGRHRPAAARELLGCRPPARPGSQLAVLPRRQRRLLRPGDHADPAEARGPHPPRRPLADLLGRDGRQPGDCLRDEARPRVRPDGVPGR